MAERVRLYRRKEGDLLRSGRIILEADELYFDLTEELWHSGGPALLSTLYKRGFFDPQRFSEWLEDADLKRALPIRAEDVLLPPLLAVEVGKIIALGKNYRAHAAEFSEEVPEEPMYFNKLPECMVGHNHVVSPPPGYAGRLDHEVELAVVIGRQLKSAAPADAMECVAGYSVANDLSLRSLQGIDRDARYPWFRSKNFDGACPIGPCFAPVTFLNEFPLNVTAHVNGELRQSSHTDEMVVKVPQALSYLSQHLTLNPGDIVLMGTPAGVGPLVDGDEVVCRIEGIGELRTEIRRDA